MPLTLCSIVVSVAAPAPEKQQEENYEPKNSVVIKYSSKETFLGHEYVPP